MEYFIAHVRVDSATGSVKVFKLTNLMDCGTVIHPDGGIAQTEGAMLWGLSLTNPHEIDIKNNEIIRK
jgi:isoquinoline 1-oxidoreductase beta subunit